MRQGKARRQPLRVEGAIYGAGLFSIGGGTMGSIAVPLLLIQAGVPAYLIGLIMGSRHFLSMIFAIHGGTLMDRLGARRIMLAAGLAATALPLLYPLSPWVGLTMSLQMLLGLTAAICWVGAQTLVGTLMEGDAVHAGRLSFAVQVGSLVSPAAAGLAWDWFGMWGSFGFMALWGAGLFVSAALLPKAMPGAAAAVPLRLGVLLPDPREYWQTLRLMAVPALGVVIAVSMLNICSASVESSFYVIYLEKIDLSATQIGLLMSASGIAAAAGSLGVGLVLRRIDGLRLLILTVAAATSSLALTPLFVSFPPLLVLALLRGAVLGLAQPLMISLVSRSAESGAQGRAVGLRTTANRGTHSVLPMVMGGIIEVVGLEGSFFVYGGLVLFGLALIGLYVTRSPAFAQRSAAE